MFIWQSFLLVLHIATAATDRFNDAKVLLYLLNQAEHPDFRDYRQPMQEIIKATLEEENGDVSKEVVLSVHW